MIVSELLVLAAMATGLLPLALLILWVWWGRKKDKRRSPLTAELLHLPGEQAQRKAESLLESASDRLMIAMLAGPLVLAGWALQRVDKQLLRFGSVEVSLLVLVVVVGSWPIPEPQRRRIMTAIEECYGQT